MTGEQVQPCAGLGASSDLPASAFDSLLAQMSVEQIPTKMELLKEGSTPDTLFVLLDGLVQLFTTREDGERVSVAILRPPAFFPVEAVLRGTVALTSARSVRSCRIGRIDADQAHRLIRMERGLAEAVINGLASRLEDMLRELKSIRARTSFQRLVAWILTMHGRADQACEIEVPYDKSVLAGRLGMAPETLSRDLARLAAWGVAVDGRRLTIKDPSVLRQLTNVDEVTRPSVP
jgi:CRP/FNR family transcriptional activator FtrB